MIMDYTTVYFITENALATYLMNTKTHDSAQRWRTAQTVSMSSVQAQKNSPIKGWGSCVKQMQITPSSNDSTCDLCDFCTNSGASSLVSAWTRESRLVLPLSIKQDHPGSQKLFACLQWCISGKIKIHM